MTKAKKYAKIQTYIFFRMDSKKHLQKLLEKIGLTESEAKFYMAVYQNPQKTIADLQKISGVSRATAYRSFERLKDLKLITSSYDNWRKNVEAVSLRTLAQKMGRESLKLRKVEIELKKLENFINLTAYQETLEPVEILSDQNQITEECYKLLHANWDHMQCYGSGEKAHEIPGEKAMHDFIKMRAKKGRTIDAVFTELGKHTRDLLKTNEQELRNGKLFIDPLCQDAITYIYDKQVTIWQKDEDLGKRAILIRDPGLIKLYQANFQKAWAAV